MKTMVDQIEYYRYRIAELAARVNQNVESQALLDELRADLENIQKALSQPAAPTDLLNSITDGLFTIGRDWRFTYVNERAASNIGITPEQLINVNLWEKFPYLVGSDLETTYRKVMESGEPDHLEFKSPRDIWYEIRVYPTSNGISVYWLDMTPKKQAEARRDIAIEHLGKMVDISARIMGAKTADSLLQIVSGASLELTGGNTAATIFSGLSGRVKSACAGDPTEVEQKQMLALAENSTFTELLSCQPAQRLDASQLAACASAYDLPEHELSLTGLLAASLTGPDGQVFGVILVTNKRAGDFSIEDEYLLTQLAHLASLALQNLQSADQARARADELNTIFNTVSDALLVYDLSGQVVRSNPAAEQLFSGAYPPAVSTPASELQLYGLDGQLLPESVQPVQAVMSTGRPSGWNRIHCHLPDGRQVEVNVSAGPLLDDSGVLAGVVSVWHDISDLEQSRRRAEQEANRAGLLAQELNSIFAAMADSVIVFDAQGNPVRLNPGAHELYDFDVIRMPLEETMTRINLRKLDGTPFTVEELPSRRALRGELVLSERAIQARSDGNDMVILSSAAPVYDSTGVITGSVVVWHDITELERIQEEYRRQRVLLERIVENAPIGIALLQGPEHRVVLGNPAFLKITHTNEDFLGHIPAEIWPDLAGRFVPDLDQVYSTASPLSGQDAPVQEDLTGAGREYVSYSYTPLFDQHDRVESILAIVDETTDQVQTHLQLEQERAFLKAVIESAPLAIVFVDEQARGLRTNAEAERLYKHPVPHNGDYTTHASLQLRYPDGRPYDPRELPLTRAALDGETFRDVDMAIAWPDGQQRDLKVNTAPIRDSAGKIIGAVGVFTDVTASNRIRRHDRFLADLGQSLLTLTESDRIYSLVTGRLREHLQAGRVMLNEVDPEAGNISVHEDHHSDLPPLTQSFDLRLIPTELTANLRRGELFKMDDSASDERVASLRPSLDEIGFRSMVLAPRLKDGRWVLSLNVSTPYPRSWHDDELALIGSVADLAWLALERSRLVKDVLASEYRFRRLFESNILGITYSQYAGPVIDANDAFLSLVGYTRADLEAGRIDWRKLTPPEYLSLDNQAVAESMERGYCTPFEKEYLRKDGRRIPVMVGFSPLDATATEFVCFVMDMSEQKHYRDALRESQRRLDMALRGSPVAMFVQDSELRYTWTFNPHPVFGNRNLIGLSDNELFEPEDAAALTALKRQVLETGKGLRQDVAVRIGGSTIIYDLSIEPQYDEQERVSGIVLVGLDMTERYRMETEMRRNAAQVEVQRTILQHREQERLQIAQDLHDGLLQELVGISLALREMARTDERRKRLAQMGQIHANLNHQIHELRAFCSELRPPTLAPFGVEKALRSFIEEYQARNPQLRIHLDLAPDGNRLNENTRLTAFRVCQELLNNIARHAQAENVWVSFALDATQVRLSVEDDGKGFVLPDRWIYLAHEGHFGLVGILERVESVSGELVIDSTPGKGTRVFVTIPI